MGTTNPQPAANTPGEFVECWLQLYCDLTTPTATTNGRFADNVPGGTQSKIWKFTGPGAPLPTADHLLTLSRLGLNAVHVTIKFNLPTGAAITDATVVVAFGRDHNNKGSSAIYTSPFKYGNGVQTFFSFSENRPVQRMNVLLGTPALFSGTTPGNKDCYAFVVAMQVDVTGMEQPSYWIGHDPEMEINM